MKKQLKNEYPDKFPGFPPIGKPGTFWRYPNIMDHYWHKLSWSEQKVFDYLLRRTFGFNKTSDRVSGSQFEKGIRGLDKGVGLDSATAYRQLEKLEKKGFIIITKAGGRTNFYHLVMSESNGKQDKKLTGTHHKKSQATHDGNEQTINSSINRKTIKREIEEIHSLYSERIDPDDSARLTPTAIQNITERLKEFSPDNLKTAITKFSSDDWSMRKNRAKGMAWFFGSEDRVEAFTKMTPLRDDDDDYSTYGDDD